MSATSSDLALHERIRVLTTAAEHKASMLQAIERGLRQELPEIPPVYFYDERGSELFDEITRLEEYYPTRAETAILELHAAELVEKSGAVELVELGSGYSRKTRLLLDALRARGGARYVALDVSEDALIAAGEHLLEDDPALDFQGLVGDFHQHLAELPRSGPGLWAFLGSTIGNLHPDERVPFLARLRAAMGDDDRFLLGVDLVKERALLEAAYDDARGVTAEFNRNVLRVLNRELGANFPLEAWAHRAFYDVDNAWIEMRLVTDRAHRVRIEALERELEFQRGDELRTELSCKFTRETTCAALEGAGFGLESWLSDPAGRFAIALARPR